VRAVSGDESRAVSTIRFSLGEETTTREIRKAVDILENHVTKMHTFNKELTQH
jgi:cysteine sulfinate desulfinase/cysteine desulfurase-like protein